MSQNASTNNLLFIRDEEKPFPHKKYCWFSTSEWHENFYHFGGKVKLTDDEFETNNYETIDQLLKMKCS